MNAVGYDGFDGYDINSDGDADDLDVVATSMSTLVHDSSPGWHTTSSTGKTLYIG